MIGALNRQLILKSRPAGLIEPSTFSLEKNPIPDLGADQVRVQVKTLSIDPTMRVWIRQKSYIDQVPLDSPMFAYGIGNVMQTNSPKFETGDLVSGMFNAQEIATMNAKEVRKLPNMPDPEVFLHTLGLNGLTAYFGMMDIGKPKAGETLVVSTAAGAVGSIVVQMGKLLGMKVIGITGSQEKVDYVKNELGADDCINYKTTENLRQDLATLCPKGIDVYFDNVGGDQLDACLALIRKFGRVVGCGAISGYNSKPTPVSNYGNIIMRSALYQGFIILDYAKRYPEALMQLGQWMSEGKIKYRHHVVKGLENFPDAMNTLFSGGNIGKVMVRLSEEPSL